MPASRPRDAATLIVLRGAKDRVEVLMGQRPGNDQWPDRYVFPGGRVDPSDSRVRTATPLVPRVERILTRACSAARARALAVAAIRETFEETGILLGKPSPTPPHSGAVWQAFSERKLAPALDELDYLCRAITPPYRPKRFNARFFTARADVLEGVATAGSELRNVAWVPLAEALDLPLPNITRAVLGVLQRHLDAGAPPVRRIPLFKMVRGTHHQLWE
jgi:8-oxo-dGTP pyrophosphatase MutT (NUDIX family)